MKAEDALLKAQEVIFREWMAAARDEKEKYRSEYFLHSLITPKDRKKVDLNLLRDFTGIYPDVTIYLENNKLFSKNNHNKNVSELKHIIKNRFVLEENAQIEFLRDSSGHFSLIKIYLNDGSIFEESKK